MAQLNEYRIRCAVSKDEVMTMSRFCKGLNDNLKKEVVLRGVFPLTKFIP